MNFYCKINEHSVGFTKQKIYREDILELFQLKDIGQEITFKGGLAGSEGSLVESTDSFMLCPKESTQINIEF